MIAIEDVAETTERITKENIAGGNVIIIAILLHCAMVTNIISLRNIHLVIG
jgi:hypothetical protein